MLLLRRCLPQQNKLTRPRQNVPTSAHKASSIHALFQDSYESLDSRVQYDCKGCWEVLQSISEDWFEIKFVDDPCREIIVDPTRDAGIHFQCTVSSSNTMQRKFVSKHIEQSGQMMLLPFHFELPLCFAPAVEDS